MASLYFGNRLIFTHQWKAGCAWCVILLASGAATGYCRGMETRIIIPLEDFPEEGLYLEGEVDGSLFGIDHTGASSISPLTYSLHAQLYENELVVRGELQATFRMRCDRCLEEFDYEVNLPDVCLSCDVKGMEVADVTEPVREEVILELPAYPKCELSGIKCKLNDIIGDFRLDKDPQSGVDSATPSGKSVWDALDKLP